MVSDEAQHGTGEHRREQDAVVVGMRFGAEDRDRVVIRRDLQEFLDGTDTGHAVADHHETGFLHFAAPSMRAPNGRELLSSAHDIVAIDRPR
jgi:hypothetical protein